MTDRHSLSRTTRGLAVAGMVLGLSLVTSGLAEANYFGTGGSGCCLYADNANETFNYDSTTSSTTNALDYAKSNLSDNTDMTTSYVGDGAQTDFVGYDQYYTTYWGLDWDGSSTGFNIFGATKCVSTDGADSGTCQRAEGRFDLADFDGFTALEKRAVTCHELGHGIGLDHSTDSTSCMQTNDPSPGDKYYSSHDIAHINGRW
jgi:hypothetical protein